MKAPFYKKIKHPENEPHLQTDNSDNTNTELTVVWRVLENHNTKCTIETVILFLW